MTDIGQDQTARTEAGIYIPFNLVPVEERGQVVLEGGDNTDIHAETNDRKKKKSLHG